jgi:hypothetical protein
MAFSSVIRAFAFVSVPFHCAARLLLSLHVHNVLQ